MRRPSTFQEREGAPMADAPRADSGRRTYAQRVDALADKINRICLLRSDPDAFHEAKDDAARTARRLALALAADGL
jgi:hypothetical protein